MELLLWLILAPTITKGLPRYLPHEITTTEKPIFTKNIYYEVQDEDKNDIYERGDSDYMTPITKANENVFNEEEKDGANGRKEEYDETRNSITMYPNEDSMQSTRQPNKNTYGRSINQSISAKESNNVQLDEKLNATMKPSTNDNNIITSTTYISAGEEKNDEQFLVNTQSTTSSKERDESDNKITREISNEEYVKPTSSTQKNTEEKKESERKVNEDDEGKDNTNDTDEQNTYDADRDQQEEEKKENRSEDDENGEKIANKDEDAINGKRMNQNDIRKIDREEEDLGKNKEERNTNKLTPRPPIECKKKDLCKRYEEWKVNYQNDQNSNQLQKGYFKHPNDASYFYTCQHGVPLCLPCPTLSLFFSEKCQMCMENVYDEICPTTKPVITQSINEDAKFCDEGYCKGRENGHFSNKEERSRFYMCSNSITYCMNCPEGLSFDEQCVRCVGTGDVGKKCDG